MKLAISGIYRGYEITNGKKVYKLLIRLLFPLQIRELTLPNSYSPPPSLQVNQ